MNENSTDKLKKGLVLVFIANAINLCISLINGFVLPKYLSVETYADIKTYQLYSNYIGVLALGYCDGLYLKYGGYKIDSIKEKDINISRSNLILLQAIVSVILIVLAFTINDKILLLTTLTIIPVNLTAAFKNIFQATGEFKFYSRIMNSSAILTFVGTMFLLFVLRSENSIYYVGVMCAVTFLVWGLVERQIRNTYGYKTGFFISLSDIAMNIKNGIVLMLGNFSSILMTSIDRWFVKFLLATTDFAYYSFIVSTENLIAIFITPIVTTMYNYICRNMDYDALKRIKRMCLIFSLFLVSSAYPAKFILEVYLNKYLPAKNVLFILFSTEILFMIIKGVYVNIYKATKRQNVYLKQLVCVLVVSCILNAIFFKLMHSIDGIAWATLFSTICWYFICMFAVREMTVDIKEIIVLIVGIVAFLSTGMLLPSIIGFVIYILVVLVLCIMFMKNDFVSMVHMASNMVGKRFSLRK